MQLEELAIRAWHKLRPASVAPHLFELPAEENRETTVYRLVHDGHEDSAVIAKRCRHDVAQVERTVYAEILPKLPFPMLQYYGSVVEPNGEFCWLFIEDVSSDMRYRPSLKRHRVAAARWLGIMNVSATGIAAARGLPQRGPAHYLELLESASDTLLTRSSKAPLSDHDRASLDTILAHCEHLRARWHQVECICAGMPQTLVHGDFIRKNVGIRTRRQEIMFFPYDWEKAGWGVPAEDISRVDIPTYWSTVRLQWPGLSSQALKRLADLGKAFRSLVFLDWIAQSFNDQSTEQPMNEVRRCESWLAQFLGAAAWQE